MKIPKKITPDPIVNSVVEFRFQPSINKEDVFLKLFNEFSSEFPKFELSNVPLQLRKEKGFEFAVEGTLSNGEYSVGIGSNVVSFNCINGYKGWNNYSQVIQNIFSKAIKTKIIKRIDRIGVRYINFFKDVEHITKHLNLLIDFGTKNEYSTNQTTFITEISKNGFTHLLNVSDKAQKQNDRGSLVDIDTSITEIKYESSKELFELVNTCRIEERTLFFSLLKEDFLAKFNPEY